MDSPKALLRGAFAAVVLVSTASLVVGVVSWPVDQTGEGPVFAVGERAAPPANGTTVVTTSMQGKNFIAAFAPNGTTVYYDDSLDVYDDVDPSPRGDATITYVATEMQSRSECHSMVPCARNVIERVNLTTGEREELYSRTTTRRRNHWHDVDRVGPDRWLVADIALDRVFVVNTTSGLIDWEWDIQNDYDLDSGGIYPTDWTHVNDVEQLPDGRVMASLRNQDQVAFVHPERGHQDDWTLGADGNHSVLFEQHNPDYIPAERGGPAVVVADSENNRVVEYQRRDGGWERTWQWHDVRMQWPRDADRLPNGNTLIVDTSGGRILEVDRAGEVVWELPLRGAYEVERLNTGDESTGGPAAVTADLASRQPASDPPGVTRTPVEQGVESLFALWKRLLPSEIVNPVLYVTPPWMGLRELTALLVLGMAAGTWAVAEAYWRGWSLRSPVVRPSDGSDAETSASRSPGTDGADDPTDDD